MEGQSESDHTSDGVDRKKSQSTVNKKNINHDDAAVDQNIHLFKKNIIYKQVKKKSLNTNISYLNRKKTSVTVNMTV